MLIVTVSYQRLRESRWACPFRSPGMASRGAGKKPTRWCSGTRAVLPGAGEPPSLVLCHPAARSVGFSVMVLCHPAAQQGSVPCGGALAPAPPAAQQGSASEWFFFGPAAPPRRPARCASAEAFSALNGSSSDPLRLRGGQHPLRLRGGQPAAPPRRRSVLDAAPPRRPAPAAPPRRPAAAAPTRSAPAAPTGPAPPRGSAAAMTGRDQLRWCSRPV